MQKICNANCRYLFWREAFKAVTQNVFKLLKNFMRTLLHTALKPGEIQAKRTISEKFSKTWNIFFRNRRTFLFPPFFSLRNSEARLFMRSERKKHIFSLYSEWKRESTRSFSSSEYSRLPSIIRAQSEPAISDKRSISSSNIHTRRSKSEEK